MLPSGLFNQEDLRSALLTNLIRETDFPVYTYEKEVTFVDMNREIEEILTGFILMTYKNNINTYVKLGKGKKGLELGRSIASSLYIRRFFIEHDAQEFLRKSQFYFNNDRNDDKKSDNTFGQDVILSMYNVGEDSSYLHNVVKSILKRFFTKTEPPKDLWQRHVISFKEFMTNFNRPIYSINKKKNRVLVGSRRPKMPSNSPVFSKDENEELSQFLSVLWGSLMNIEKFWGDLSLDDLHDAKRYASRLIEHRWSTVVRYSKMTTKRLEAIREFANLGRDIKKAGVNQEHLASYLQVNGTVDNFYKSLLYLADKDERKAFIEYRMKLSFPTYEMARVSYLIWLSKNKNLGDLREEVKASDYSPTEFNSNDIESCVYFLLKADSKISAYNLQRESCKKNSSTLYKFTGSLNQLYGCTKNLLNTCKVIKRSSFETIQLSMEFIRIVLRDSVSPHLFDVDELIKKLSFIEYTSREEVLKDSGIARNSDGMVPQYLVRLE